MRDQDLLRYGVSIHAERIAQQRVKKGQVDEAVEFAADKVLDRACRRMLSYVTNTEITRRIIDYEKLGNGIGYGFGNAHCGELEGFQYDTDKQQHQDWVLETRRDIFRQRELVVRVLSDFCTLSRRSWLYFKIAGLRNVNHGWRGRFAAVYIDTGDNAAVSRITRQLQTLEKQIVAAAHAVCIDGEIESSLLAFSKQLAGNCQKLVEDCEDFTTEEQFRIPLLQQALTALIETRPEGGFVSEQYPELCATLESLTLLLTDDSRIDKAKTAAAELMKAVVNGGIVECGALIPWLESLPQSHPREYDCESVLIGIQELPMRMADEPDAPAVRKSRKGFGDYKGFVDGMFTTVKSQQPDRTLLECIQECMTRSEALKFMAGEPGLSPAALLQENGELVDEMDRVVTCWKDGETRQAGTGEKTREPNDLRNDTKFILPGIQLDDATLEECSRTLRLWAVPGEVPQSWAEVDEAIRTPLLAAIVIGSMGRLRSALKSVHAQLKEREKEAAKE
ncbi:MAG: hypothetical protein O3B13_22900 [Planctomycetota bacterium]|nr:hypothetical protein [Planctomycetota bacterium]